MAISEDEVLKVPTVLRVLVLKVPKVRPASTFRPLSTSTFSTLGTSSTVPDPSL